MARPKRKIWYDLTCNDWWWTPSGWQPHPVFDISQGASSHRTGINTWVRALKALDAAPAGTILTRNYRKHGQIWTREYFIIPNNLN